MKPDTTPTTNLGPNDSPLPELKGDEDGGGIGDLVTPDAALAGNDNSLGKAEIKEEGLDHVHGKEVEPDMHAHDEDTVSNNHNDDNEETTKVGGVAPPPSNFECNVTVVGVKTLC